MIRIAIKHYIVDYILNSIFINIQEFTNKKVSGTYLTENTITEDFMYIPIYEFNNGKYKYILGKTCTSMYLIYTNESPDMNELTKSRHKYSVRISGLNNLYIKDMDIVFNDKCNAILL